MIKISFVRSLLSLLLAVLAVTVTLQAKTNQVNKATSTKASTGKISWRSQLKPALAEARRSGKPVLLYIYSESCLPCREMNAKTYNQPAVISAANGWIPVKVNGEMDLETAYDFKAETFPKIVSLKPDGSIATQATGFRSAEQVIEAMRVAAVKS